jgi:hypothetical protein
MASVSDPKTQMEALVAAVDGARQKLLDYDPPWIDPGYETVREDVDRALRQAQLGIGKLFEDVSTSPTERASS